MRNISTYPERDPSCRKEGTVVSEIRAELCRREFLKVGFVAGVGLLVECHLPGGTHAADARTADTKGGKGSFEPNAWLRIGTDDTVTVVVNHSEMGQGITTALAMVIGEELEVDWVTVRPVIAPAKPVYKNPAFGVQATGGSTSLQTSWDILRQAGAVAREMLIAAASKSWGVAASECRAIEGSVVHNPSGRRLRYGELAGKTAGIPAPSQVSLKNLGERKLIGKPLGRLDSRMKTEGRAIFGTDVSLPNLLVATVLHPPVLGGSLQSYDAAKAKALKGVRHVVPVGKGIAVVADTFWAAKKASDALEVKWDAGENINLDMQKIRTRWKDLAKQGGERVRDDGNVEGAFRQAAQIIEAVYELPFQAHGCPEPMNCTAHVKSDGCDVWVPTQNQGGTQEIAAAITGLDLDRVRVHTTFLGGGFGRRGDVDFVAEAVEISKAVNAPVKVMWTREEDIRNDHYRPASYHAVRAGLDKNRKVLAFSHVLVGPSFLDPTIEIMAPAILPGWLPRSVKDVVAGAAAPIVKYFSSAKAAVEGGTATEYAIENVRVEYVKDDPGVPVGAWRSVSPSQNAFVVESFMDEIARAAGKDPYELRYELLSNAPKHRGVLKLAAEKAGWGNKLPEGVFRGIAVHAFHDTPAAMVAEISVDRKGGVKVHRVVAAVDCGIVINPKIVEAQMVGGIAFGLTAVLKGKVTIKKGRVQQSNFDNFPLLRMDEMPKVEVHIVASTNPPTGIGEVPVPPIGPAVTNAIFAATGKRIRTIPVTADMLS
jgi:isoquinoline 1-oxidoreductase beta subunit